MDKEKMKENGRNGINNIKEIMIKDLKSAVKNPIGIIVLLAIIILPSLYGLVNIYACWDPYENTDNIQFAISNEDQGATYEGQTLNVGNDLVEMLKNDTNFKWTFMSSEQLRRGVDNGTYYAGIIVPSNFTQSVVSITSDNPHSAQLNYIVNEKTNPVAAKLTDSAAKSVYNNINAEIVTFINLAAYGKLGELQSSLASGAVQMSSGATQLSGGASQVSSGAGAVSDGANQLSSGANQLSDGAKEVSSGASQVSSGASNVASGASQVSDGANQLSNGASKVSGGASQLSQAAKAQKSPLSDGIDNIASGASEVASKSNALSEGASQVSSGASDVASGASQVSSGASNVASGADSLAGGADELASGSLSLAAGAELLANSAASALLTASSSLYLASNSLSDVTGVDENQVGDYFYAPVKLEKQELYPASNYGSQVAPFYIVLSMWVGAIITCVMLKVGSSQGTKYKPHEVYAGKLLIFNIIVILQTTVTIIGCYLLGIDVGNDLMFIFSAYFVALFFMILIYSLISVFGQVGKGLSIILLVFQISGTGGIYPVDIMSGFFSFIYPYLPMTHGINLLRESLLGLKWTNYLPSFAWLLIGSILIVMGSVVLKQRWDKRTKYFEEKLIETNLFS